MSLGTAAVGNLIFASHPSTELDGPPGTTPVAVSPFTIEISGTTIEFKTYSLTIDVEAGRQGTAQFASHRLVGIPRIGEAVRILWNSDLLFAGSIDKVSAATEPSNTYNLYTFECVDNSYLLFRKKIRATFSNQTVSQIATALISSYLASDGVTLGTVDSMPTIPLADAQDVSIFEFLNDIAASVGTMFFIDNEKKLNFINESIEDSELVIEDETVEEYSVHYDRETYRNRQTVIVTGTPPSKSIDPLTVTFTMTNSDSATDQSAIEGTGGIYSDIESIVHPTENTTIPLTKLAIAYAIIRLGITGSIRQMLRVRTREYGFRPGQLVTVSLSNLELSGSWIIQRMSLQEEAGINIVTTLELTNSSLLRRAQELWLEVVRKGRVVVVPPSAIVTNQQVYSTPGTYQFVVPADTYILQYTLAAAGGGGGGGSYSHFNFKPVRFNAGASGGRGGLAIGVLNVSPDEVLTIVVGAGGSAGVSVQKFNDTSDAVGTNGGNGGNSSISRVGGTVGLAYGGQGGFGGRSNAWTGLGATFLKGADGGGLFSNVVTVGGGSSGGNGGNGSPLHDGTAGFDGRVTMEW